MRSVSLVSRAVVLLLAALLISVPAAYADDPPNPLDPPEARIKIPIGVAASDTRIKPPIGVASDALINPPAGEPATDAHIGPPSREPSFFELVLEWLRAQARIRTSAE